MFFDNVILKFLNQFVGKAPFFDNLVLMVSYQHIFKMTPMVLVLWGFWFQKRATDQQNQVRYDLFRGFIACFLAMTTARLLTRIFPYRQRPLRVSELDLNIVTNLDPNFLDKWSSLPSDHAALAFALAVTVYFVNKRWGILCLLHSLIIICLPRLYLSLHFPSDILVGALIGILSVWLFVKTKIFEKLSHFLFSFEQSHPALFYVVFLFLCTETCEMFEDIRKILGLLGHILYLKPV